MQFKCPVCNTNNHIEQFSDELKYGGYLQRNIIYPNYHCDNCGYSEYLTNDEKNIVMRSAIVEKLKNRTYSLCLKYKDCKCPLNPS